MKNLFIISLVLLCCNPTYAQGIYVKSGYFQTKTLTEQVCHDKAQLSSISDSMFQQGNPNYIYVDLYKDGYIDESSDFIVIPSVEGSGSSGDRAIPAQTGKEYGEKWTAFIRSLGQPYPKNNNRLHLLYTVTYQQIINPESEFRKFRKSDLHALGLTTTGELRLLKELVKDGLITEEDPLNLEFSTNGFFVMEKRLPYDLREKYRQLCIDEFGIDYYTRYNSIKRGALPENPLKKEIAELTARIDAAQQNTNR